MYFILPNSPGAHTPSLTTRGPGSSPTQPAFTPKLDADTFFIIADLLDDKKAVMALMQLSKELYYIAAPHLLRVVMQDADFYYRECFPKLLTSFCDFMLSSIPSANKFKYLTTWSIESWDPSTDDEMNSLPHELYEKLGAVMSSAIEHLTYLDIHWVDEFFFFPETNIFESICSSTKLKVLHLHFYDSSQVMDFIPHRLQCHLEELKLEVDNWSQNDHPVLVLGDMVSMHQRSLTKLVCKGLNLDFTGALFPSVTTIDLNSCAMLSTESLLRTFPNLEVISLNQYRNCHCFADRHSLTWEEHKLIEHAGKNWRFQRRPGRRNKFTRLNMLGGELDHLFALSVSGPVEVVGIGAACDSASGFPRRIANVVRTTKPTTLILVLQTKSLLWTNRVWAEILFGQTQLRKLDFRFEETVVDPSLQFPFFFDRLSVIASLCPVKAISVEVTHRSEEGSDGLDRASLPSGSPFMDRRAEKPTDVVNVLQPHLMRVSHRAPTLESITVSLPGSFRGVWSVTRNEGNIVTLPTA